MKYSFYNDYSEGAHPNILKLLFESSLEQNTGYGYDKHSLRAKELIKAELKSDSDIYFVSGGTQANLIGLSSMLKSYEAVIAPITGHIAVHEAGAIEATGHKVITVQTKNGKLTPALIEPVLKMHEDEHMVKPKVVFISNSTEVGTHYTKNELEVLSTFCRANSLLLYLDGARLASGLVVKDTNLQLSELARLTDIFYIGGTKNGALLGEALVINNSEFKPNYIRSIKQRGGLLAKGSLLGIQFEALFSNNLYFKLAEQANAMAQKITIKLEAFGVEFLTESKTNQIFPIFENQVIEKIQKEYGFYIWNEIENTSKSAIRLVTSWATEEKNIDEFLSDIAHLLNR